MRILCPTCNGTGTISDPKCIGKCMCYSGPNGETIPQVMCQTCWGSGWILVDYPLKVIDCVVVNPQKAGE